MTEKARFWLLFIIFFAIAVGLAAINLHTPWREAIRDVLLTEKRVILAQAKGELVSSNVGDAGAKRDFTVLKILTREAILIEVFEIEASTGRSLFRARATLPERRDGYINYKGSATNFLLLDVNNDGALEIIAPAFDENLIPRVHVYRFNDETSSLELLDTQAFQK